MAAELSAADRSSLSAEQGPINMAVGGVLVFDGGPGMAQDAILGRVADRLHLIPQYRRRLQAPAGGVLNPVSVGNDDYALCLPQRVGPRTPCDADQRFAVPAQRCTG